MKRQPLSVRARSCCCLGFWAESEKIKTSVAEVGGGGKNTRGNSNPRNLSVLPMRSAGKETAGLDPQAAPTCRRSLISTQGWLMCLGSGLGCSNCTKVFVFNSLLLSLY